MLKISKTDLYKKITGITDNLGHTNNYSDDVFIDEACRLISEVPRFFSDTLDRMTMWDRIGNGLCAAVSKSDGNLRLFVNYLVEYVKADYGKFASCETINNIINTFELREKEWQKLFVENCHKFSFLIIAKSRQMWMQKTKKNAVDMDMMEAIDENI